MKRALSILIPTYNDDCTALVEEIHVQASQIDGLCYEIIVADDGSTDVAVVERNRRLSVMEHCKVVRYEENRGRAAIRNALAAQAQYEWLLFIDSGHMRLCKEDYLREYLSADEAWQVVYGGYCLSVPSDDIRKSNLRYKYEARSVQNASAARRCEAAAHDFHSSNFLARASLWQCVQFDERFVRYGYEDVFLGKVFSSQGIAIHHIDNPTLFCGYEDNSTYLRKTMEALRTLKEFEGELQGYSRLLRTTRRLTTLGIAPLLRHLYHARQAQWTDNLQGTRPSLFIFNLFKIGFYLSL